MILIYEGPDGAGKSMLMEAVHGATNYEHVAIDRMHLSHIVYSQYYQRDLYMAPKKLESFLQNFKKFVIEQKPLIIYVKADAPVLEERIRRRGEDLTKSPSANVIMKLYDHWFHTLGFTERVITVDTSFDPPMDDTVARVVGKIKSLERRHKSWTAN